MAKYLKIVLKRPLDQFFTYENLDEFKDKSLFGFRVKINFKGDKTKGFVVGAMDDFGSGESSLNMLTKVPVDVLKFDRDFLRSSTNEDGKMDEKSAKFIQGLIDLSKNLEKETIFEGVETVEQRDFLKAASCDQVQGFFYSKPLSEEDFVKFMEEHSK